MTTDDMKLVVQNDLEVIWIKMLRDNHVFQWH